MRVIEYREAICEAISEEMDRDNNVFLIGEDVEDPMGGAFGASKGLSTKYGRRVRNTPISEAAIVGAVVGAAMVGMRPIAEIMYVDFLGCCLDPIANQAAKIRYMSGGQIEAPMVLRTQQGAGMSSAAQHAQSLEAIFAHIPGLKVVMPSCPADAKGLLKTAIRDDDPVIFLEHKLLYGMKCEVPEGDILIPFGKAMLRREGGDVTVLATSRMVHVAIEAADMLKKEGINLDVLDLRTIVPLDKEAIFKSLKKTGRLVIVQEAVKRCGFASEISAMVNEESFDFLEAPIIRIASINAPVAFAPKLEEYLLPNAEKVCAGIKKIL